MGAARRRKSCLRQPSDQFITVKVIHGKWRLAISDRTGTFHNFLRFRLPPLSVRRFPAGRRFGSAIQELTPWSKGSS